MANISALLLRFRRCLCQWLSITNLNLFNINLPMDEQNQGQSEYYETNTASKVKDIEEKQNQLTD